MQFAQGQEQSEAGNAGMAGQAAAALPYYIHDAMHVRLSCSLSSITVRMLSMPALAHSTTPKRASCYCMPACDMVIFAAHLCNPALACTAEPSWA